MSLKIALLDVRGHLLGKNIKDFRRKGNMRLQRMVQKKNLVPGRSCQRKESDWPLHSKK
jgi:hypothetical protein